MKKDQRYIRMTFRDRTDWQHAIINELYEFDLEEMRDILSKGCLKVIEVNGDGNCLFRSVADQVYGN